MGIGLGEDIWSREIQKAILQVRIDGFGVNHTTCIFPKIIFVIKEGLNLKQDDPNYDIKQLALTCATKRMYPDVDFYDNIKDLTGSYKVSMSCRSRLDTWIDPKTGEPKHESRFNIGVHSLNLVNVALSAKTICEFWKILDERLEVAEEAMAFRIQNVLKAKPGNAPILYKEGAYGKITDNDSVSDLILNKRATISLGYTGMYEVGVRFFGSEWESNPLAKEFTVSVLKYLDDWCKPMDEKYDVHFSCYGTPFESGTHKLCQADKQKFGVIKDITDKGYYTNSFHYDVRKKPNPFEKLKFEVEYLPYTTGGFIQYSEYSRLDNREYLLEQVWDYANSIGVGYLGTNTPIDKCFECGSNDEFKATADGFKCSNCGNDNPETCDVTRRINGYLGQPQKRKMIAGRHKEIISREKNMEV